MADLFDFPVMVRVEADGPEDAIVALHRRMGFDQDWKARLPEMYREGNLLAEDEVRPEMVKAAARILQHNPANCQEPVCCKGLVRFRHKPLCQLNEQEQAQLMQALDAMTAQVRAAPGGAEALDKVVLAPAPTKPSGS